ncbi:MAG: putative cell wall-binding protein [Firmicutes bacterium]|nr:putative cell wall-binding protein [Bacillota bacterium]
MTKRFITALAATMLLVGTTMPAPAATAASSDQALPSGARESTGYSDLSASHWAYGPVTKLREAGVLLPDPSGKFRPDEPVSRAEFLKMLFAARGIDTGSDCAAFFSDAACWAWYTPVVETAYRMAIDDGRGNGRFDPDGQVTRQELVDTLIRVLGQRRQAETLSSGEVAASLKQLSDRGQIADSARPAVALALRKGLVSGRGDGTFRPGVPASRAEAAAIVSRVLLASDVRKTVSREGGRALDSGDTAAVDGRVIHFKQAFKLTASMYSSGEPGVGSWTATGIRVRPGTVAVDPNVIALGSLLYVEGYGYAIAADTGGAIKGNRIDLYTASYDQAIDFGMQSRRVWLLP